MTDYLQAPAIQCPYTAKTTDIRANVDGTVQSRVLIHEWSTGLGRLIAIVDDEGHGGALNFDFNPNSDAVQIVAEFNAWLAEAYPNTEDTLALTWLYDFLTTEEEAGRNA